MFLFIFFFIFSSLSDGLYGLPRLDDSVLQLCKFSPTDLTSVPISEKFPTHHTSQGLSSLDSSNQMFYAITYSNTTKQRNYLVGIDINTGVMKYTLDLPIINPLHAGIGQSIQCDGKGNVFVVGLEEDKKHHILSIDAEKGNIKEIASFGGMDDMVHFGSAYDASRNYLYLMYVPINKSDTIYSHIYVHDMNDPDAKIVYDIENTALIRSFVYDPKNKIVLGLGMKLVSGQYEIHLYSFVDGEINDRGLIDGEYSYVAQAEAALDIDGSYLYAFLRTRMSPPSDPWDLLQIGIGSGIVVENKCNCYMAQKGNFRCPLTIHDSHDIR